MSTQRERIEVLEKQVNHLTEERDGLVNENAKLTTRAKQAETDRDTARRDEAQARALLAGYEQQAESKPEVATARKPEDPFWVYRFDGTEPTPAQLVRNQDEGDALMKSEPDTWFEDAGEAIKAYFRRKDAEANGTE